MTLLLDGNVVLPAALTPDLLKPRVQALLLDSSNHLFVSHATLWELLAKVYRGQVRHRGQAASLTIGDIEQLGAEFLAITQDDIVAAIALPDHHRDPFDRMLVAQAQRLHATIVSSDRVLSQYGVPVIPL